MAGILELPELPQHDRLPEREVRAAGIDAELDPEGPSERELVLQPALGDESTLPLASVVSASAAMARAMLPAHSPILRGQGYTRPR